MKKFICEGQECISMCETCIHNPPLRFMPKTNIMVESYPDIQTPNLICDKQKWTLPTLIEDETGDAYPDVAECKEYELDPNYNDESKETGADDSGEVSEGQA